MRKILFASLIIFNVSLFSNDSKIIQKINNVLPDGLKVISVQDSEINGIKIDTWNIGYTESIIKNIITKTFGSE